MIRKLYRNKAHGRDKISIRMLKINYKTICKPLYMIIRSYVEKRDTSFELESNQCQSPKTSSELFKTITL